MQLLRRRITLETSLDSEKDYIGIEKVADALCKIVMGAKETVYNVASGINTTHGALVEQISAITGCEVVVKPGAKTVRFPMINIDRIREEFGYRPSDILTDLPRDHKHVQGRR